MSIFHLSIYGMRYYLILNAIGWETLTSTKNTLKHQLNKTLTILMSCEHLEHTLLWRHIKSLTKCFISLLTFFFIPLLFFLTNWKTFNHRMLFESYGCFFFSENILQILYHCNCHPEKKLLPSKHFQETWNLTCHFNGMISLLCTTCSVSSSPISSAHYQ